MAKQELYYNNKESRQAYHHSMMMISKSSSEEEDSLMCTSPTSPSLFVEHYAQKMNPSCQNKSHNNSSNAHSSQTAREILADITSQAVVAAASRMNGQGAFITSTTTVNTSLKTQQPSNNSKSYQQGQSTNSTTATHYYPPSTSTSFPCSQPQPNMKFVHTDSCTTQLSYSNNNRSNNNYNNIHYTHTHSATGKTKAAVSHVVGIHPSCRNVSTEPKIFSPSVTSPVLGLDFGEFQMMQDEDDYDCEDNEESLNEENNDQDEDYLFCKDDEEEDDSDDDCQHYFTLSQDNYSTSQVLGVSRSTTLTEPSRQHATCNMNNTTMNSHRMSNHIQARQDPDLYNDHDRMRLKQALDYNVDHPVNLLPKFNKNQENSQISRLPIEVEQDVLAYLFENESRKQPSLDALRSTQTIVTPDMRSMLIEWLAGICVGFKLRPETYYTSVNVLDRFLCQHRVENTKFLQGIGLASLLIAAKFCEITCPPLKQLLFAADNFYTRRAILNWESEICNILDFEFCTVHAFDFIEKFLEICGYSQCDQVRMLSYFICELQLQNFHTLQFQRHTVAICSIIIALYMFRQPYLTPNVLYCVRLSENFFESANGSLTRDDVQILDTTNKCLSTMFNFYIGMITGTIKYNFVVDKYSKDSFMNIATWFPSQTNHNFNIVPPQFNLQGGQNQSC
ncbi:hypothetical protein FDP41_001393 [Naegleria fowleri]|uniref:Uncharacterized protein n=1 Tax=Naegleria fowleri TaxID=5763 RepID=A0A6A5C2J1_NAEFO|nr:uncharacterized protein FDP41_001393 [Naegleria fowleri]KAF0979725.1 hypothetical protein FDP41_001393 [Naegleria fowleri]